MSVNAFCEHYMHFMDAHHGWKIVYQHSSMLCLFPFFYRGILTFKKKSHFIKCRKHWCRIKDKKNISKSQTPPVDELTSRVIGNNNKKGRISALICYHISLTAKRNGSSHLSLNGIIQYQRMYIKSNGFCCNVIHFLTFYFAHQR